jgi:hypothetical protein
LLRLRAKHAGRQLAGALPDCHNQEVVTKRYVRPALGERGCETRWSDRPILPQHPPPDGSRERGSAEAGTALRQTRPCPSVLTQLCRARTGPAPGSQSSLPQSLRPPDPSILSRCTRPLCGLSATWSTTAMLAMVRSHSQERRLRAHR